MFQNIQKIQALLDKAASVLKGLNALHSTLQHLFDQFRPAGSVVVVAQAPRLRKRPLLMRLNKSPH